MTRTKMHLDSRVICALSERLFPLGNDIDKICSDLLMDGFGDAAQAEREFYEELAGAPAARDALRRYRREYAKERLAALHGPMDILERRLPEFTAYRSAFLDQLYDEVKNGDIRTHGPIVSPQIEPTLKWFLEKCDHALFLHLKNRSEAARQAAAQRRFPDQIGNLSGLSPKQLLATFFERHAAGDPEPNFSLETKNNAVILRKPVLNGELNFIFCSRLISGMGVGAISAEVALSLPQARISPGFLANNVVASFSPEILVPGFNSSLVFDQHSYAEFYMAIDTSMAFAKRIFKAIDKALENGIAVSGMNR